MRKTTKLTELQTLLCCQWGACQVIYAILGSQDITDEEFWSAVVGAGDLINSRPLTYHSRSQGLPGSPSLLIIFYLVRCVADLHAIVSILNHSTLQRDGVAFRNLYVIFGIDGFTSGFPAQVHRKSGAESKLTLKQETSPDTPKGEWPLGRIVKVLDGKDNKVRVVDVQVRKTVLWRPFVKLCPLERCWTLSDLLKTIFLKLFRFFRNIFYFA